VWWPRAPARTIVRCTRARGGEGLVQPAGVRQLLPRVGDFGAGAGAGCRCRCRCWCRAVGVDVAVRAGEDQRAPVRLTTVGRVSGPAHIAPSPHASPLATRYALRAKRSLCATPGGRARAPAAGCGRATATGTAAPRLASGKAVWQGCLARLSGKARVWQGCLARLASGKAVWQGSRRASGGGALACPTWPAACTAVPVATNSYSSISLTDAELFGKVGRKTPIFLAVQRSARPYRSTPQDRFTIANVGCTRTPREGPDSADTGHSRSSSEAAWPGVGGSRRCAHSSELDSSQSASEGRLNEPARTVV
jgi:hypothetical protein